MLGGPFLTTIRDVAREAKVSIATVSYVLNQSRKVNPDTKRRVIDAVNKLNYKPSRIAKSLVTRQSNMIGVIVSDISNPFFAPIVRGIEDMGCGSGYIVMVGNCDENSEKAEKYVDILLQHQIDGLIISPPVGFRNSFVTSPNFDTPIVYVNRKNIDSSDDVVETDNKLGSYLAVKHLHSLGHQRIGIIAGPQKVSTYSSRLEGFISALDHFNIPLKSEYLCVAEYTPKSGYEMMKNLIGLPNRPTGIFVSSGLLSRGAYLAIKESGIQIPYDLSVVAFDETEWAPLVEVPLTTISQQTYQMGKRSGKLLLEKIQENRTDREKHFQEDNNKAPRIIQLEPKLIIRNSTSIPFTNEEN